MDLMISIFGGMVLTAVLYALGRALRLANFWAAVIGAGIPSVLYLFHAAVTTPALDVITMHVVAYPTVALMLYLLYGNRGGQAAGGSHWIPKLIVAFFIGLSVLYSGFVYVARQGLPPEMAAWLLPNADEGRVHTGFSGVVGHGGDAARGVSYHRKMQARLAEMGWHVEIVGLDRLRVLHANDVQVLIRDARGVPVSGVDVGLELGRPGQAQAPRIALPAHGAATYQALVSLPGEGEWLARIHLQAGGEHLVLEHLVGRE